MMINAINTATGKLCVVRMPDKVMAQLKQIYAESEARLKQRQWTTRTQRLQLMDAHDFNRKRRHLLAMKKRGLL